MSIRFREGHRIFVYSEYVDMRSGFCRLSYFVREKMERDLLEGDLYLFLGKTRKLLKAICFDGTGLMLISKRLERGKFMELKLFEDFSLTTEELDLILRGSSIRRRSFGVEALTRKRSEITIGFHGADRT